MKKSIQFLKRNGLITNEFGAIIYECNDETHRINLAMTLDDYAEPLLDLLQESLLQIKYLQEKFKETGSGNAVINRLETTIEEYRKD